MISEQILSLVHDKAFLINGKFQIVYQNNIPEIGGNSQKTLCYKTLFNFDQPCHFCPLVRGLSEYSGTVSLTNQTFSKKKYDKIVLSQLLLDEGGQSLALDIIHLATEEKGDLAASEQLATLGAHVQTIGHELANPLTGLHLTFQKIRDMTQRKEELRSSSIKPLLGLLEKDIFRASEILSDIRNFSKPLTKPMKIVDLKSVIQSSFENVKRQCPNQKVNVDINWAIPVDLRLFGNSGKLEQCFINLLKNSHDMFAIRGIREGALIRIEGKLTDSADIIEIQIIDNAGGISNDALKKVFRPYFTTKERYRGLGLGLYITSKILKEHGGSIQMNSVDDKTVVTIRINLHG